MSKRAVLPLLALTLLVALAGVSCKGFFVNPTLSSITVAPQNASLNIGASLQFTASGVNNDGTNASLHNLTWSSSASNIATITSSGMAKGVASGTATITATDGGVTGSSTLTVGSTSNTLTLSPANQTVSLSASGGFEQFSATFNGTNVTSSTTWSSSNTSVAVFSTSSPGLASLQSAGLTTITATYTPTGGTTASGTTSLTVTQ
jgi:trimeric autotransporter adhesin